MFVAVQDGLWPEQHFITSGTAPMKCFNSLGPSFSHAEVMFKEWPWFAPGPCSNRFSSGKGMPLQAPESRVLLTDFSLRPCPMAIVPARLVTPEEADDPRFEDITGRKPKYVVWESTLIDDLDHPMFGGRYLLFDNLKSNCDAHALRVFTGVIKPGPGDEDLPISASLGNPAFRKSRRAATSPSTAPPAASGSGTHAADPSHGGTGPVPPGAASTPQGAGPAGKTTRSASGRAAKKKKPAYEEVESQDEGDFNTNIPPSTGARDGAKGAEDVTETGNEGAGPAEEDTTSEDDDDDAFRRKRKPKPTQSATRRRPAANKDSGAHGKAPRKQPSGAHKGANKLKAKSTPVVTVVEEVPRVATPPAEATTSASELVTTVLVLCTDCPLARSRRRSQAELYGTVGTRELPDRQRGASVSPRKSQTNRDTVTPAPTESSKRAAAKRKRNAEEDDEDDAVTPEPVPAASSQRKEKRSRPADNAATPAPAESSKRAEKRKRAIEEEPSAGDDDTQPAPAKRVKKKESTVQKSAVKPNAKSKAAAKKDGPAAKVSFAKQALVRYVRDEADDTVPPPAGSPAGAAAPPAPTTSLLPDTARIPGPGDAIPDIPVPEPINVREQRALQPDFEIPASLDRQFGLMWQFFYTAWNKGATPSGLTLRRLNAAQLAWPNAIPRPDSLDQLLLDMSEFPQ